MIALCLVTLLLSIPVARARHRAHRGTVLYLAEHTNAILAKKCRPTYSSLRGSWPLWRRRHRLAHRAKLGTCTPWPSWWRSQAECIGSHEGAWTSDTGNGYGGRYQFLVGTFNRAAGGAVPVVHSTGEIARLSPFVQTLAAWRIWKQDGGSWREWGTAGMCGLS